MAEFESGAPGSLGTYKPIIPFASCCSLCCRVFLCALVKFSCCRAKYMYFSVRKEHDRWRERGPCDIWICCRNEEWGVS